MAEPIVQISTRLWSEEVARAEAQQGEGAIAALLITQKPVVYEFRGRKFVEGNGPYAPIA